METFRNANKTFQQKLNPLPCTIKSSIKVKSNNLLVSIIFKLLVEKLNTLSNNSQNIQIKFCYFVLRFTMERREGKVS